MLAFDAERKLRLKVTSKIKYPLQFFINNGCSLPHPDAHGGQPIL